MTASFLRTKDLPIFGTIVLPLIMLCCLCFAGCGEGKGKALEGVGEASDVNAVVSTFQDQAFSCMVVLKGGQVLEGRLLSDEKGVVTLQTSGEDTVELPWMLIRCVEKKGAPDIYSVEPPPLPPEDAAGVITPKSLVSATEKAAAAVSGEATEAEAEPPPGPPFMRYVAPKKDAPGALEVGVQRFHDAGGDNDVFLIGVVHVAEPAYFERLQDVLDSMDTVLFEGVGGKRGGDETATLDTIIKLQLILKDSLGLTYQKDGLCYDRSFWTNSDMTWAEVQAELDREGLELIPGEKVVTMFSNALFKFWQPGQRKLSRGASMRLRRFVAPMLGNADKLMAQYKELEGMDKVVIKARNDVVVDDLGEWLEENSGRRVGIFYGAGHMRDMKAKIMDRFDLRYVGHEWRQAWIVE